MVRNEFLYLGIGFVGALYIMNKFPSFRPASTMKMSADRIRQDLAGYQLANSMSIVSRR